MTARLERPFLVSTLAAFKLVIAAVCLIEVLFLLLQDRSLEEESRIIVFVFASPALLALVCAHGLWTLRRHGRWLQVGFSLLGLVVGFPIGSIFSAIVLWEFLRPGTGILFSGRPLSSLGREELDKVVEVLPSFHGTVF